MTKYLAMYKVITGKFNAEDRGYYMEKILKGFTLLFQTLLIFLDDYRKWRETHQGTHEKLYKYEIIVLISFVVIFITTLLLIVFLSQEILPLAMQLSTESLK